MNSGLDQLYQNRWSRQSPAQHFNGHTIRFAPPLVITKEEIDEALAQIGEVLN